MVSRSIVWIFIFGSCAMLAACGSAPKRAPVIERAPTTVQPGKPAPVAVPAAKEPDWRPQTYTVQKGDTLFSIALEHGQDYRDVAEWNGIPAPFIIKIGQVLKLAPPGDEPASDGAVALKLPTVVSAKPLVSTSVPSIKSEPKAVKEIYSAQALAKMEKSVVAVPGATVPTPKPAAEKPAPEPTSIPEKRDEPKAAADDGDPDKLDWAWPANGRIVANFNDNGNNKGLDIAGAMGESVTAAAAGKVVHTGTTLRGYGKLVIIKHNKSYFSVYAHNSQILVKEGQSVVRGQKIAEMGDSDSDRVKLHFEIRKLGKPIDPLKYLPNDRAS